MQKNKNVHTNGGTAAIARKPIKIPHVYVIICAIILFAHWLFPAPSTPLRKNIRPDW